MKAGGGRQQLIARPSQPLAASDFLITGEEAVHGVLNLGAIRDPDRWLRRHDAPVAIDTGPSKRYLASAILRWAAEKFGVDESSKRALGELAARLEDPFSATNDAEEK